MTKPEVIHGTGGHIWTGDSDTPPATAIPIKDWTMTLKPEYRDSGFTGGLMLANPIASLTGGFSGVATWVAAPRRVPGGRKAGRMRRRGY